MFIVNRFFHHCLGLSDDLLVEQRHENRAIDGRIFHQYSQLLTDITPVTPENDVLLAGHQPAIVHPAITEVMPGTGLYEQAKAVGFISDDYWLTDLPAPYYTVEHDEEQLKAWYWEIQQMNSGGIDSREDRSGPA